VGCGASAPKTTLLRLALVHPTDGPAQVVLDPAATMAGRGAYLCASGRAPLSQCLRRAGARGGLSRAFRARVTLSPDFVESIC
jgi:predicted RNA-binding protein YlxR (DUF448 family)